MEYQNFWTRLSPVAKAAIAIITVLVVLAPIGFVYVLHDKEYQALYTNLSQEEAAKAVESLQKMKVDYRLNSTGDAILVQAGDLAEIKLGMINEGYSTGSGVGFEVFDDAAYTMSDFAKKVNYQRALQGELSRSIGQLKEVRSARVHLVLPEKRFFETDRSEPKASVILRLHKNAVLSMPQIEGIQSLVASAAEAMNSQSVIVSNEHGVILSRQYGEDKLVSHISRRKQDLESSLEAKCLKLLEHVFGKDQAVVNINVSLATSEVQAKKETILAEQNGKGVLVKSKQSVTKRTGDKQAGRKAGNVTQETTETQYETGRLVETRVTKPGDIEKVNLSVMVPYGVTNSQLDSLRELLGAAAGIDERRGDTFAIERLPKLYTDATSITTNHNQPEELMPKVALSEPKNVLGEISSQYYLYGAIGVAAFLLLAILVMAFKRRETYQLDHIERQQLLLEMQGWLRDDAETVRE